MYRLLLVTFILFGSCIGSENALKSGTFDVYENDKFVARIYRLNNYQIEEDQEDGTITLVKIEWKSNNSMITRTVEENTDQIYDTEYLIKHEKIEKYKYKITGMEYPKRDDYVYEAILEKSSSEIKEEYLKQLESLNKN